MAEPSPAPTLPSTRTWFDGRLEIIALPTYASPNADPGPKRMLLPQGEYTLLHPACPELRFCALLGFQPGASRGGHFHREKVEWLYVMRGRLRLTARDRTTGERVEAEANTGELIHILPEVEHRLTTIEPGEVLELSAFTHNPADTIRAEI